MTPQWSSEMNTLDLAAICNVRRRHQPPGLRLVHRHCLPCWEDNGCEIQPIMITATIYDSRKALC